MAFEEKTVRTVIEVLHDGQRGFESLSEKVTSPSTKSFFEEEAVTRGRFATELETALGAEIGKPVNEGGTASGAVHRAWGDIKGKLGGSDHTLLETAEQGEDVAKKAYEEALKVSGIPPSITSILKTQQPHIQKSHDKVKALRDSTAA
jgi:uncharacterized protein (TIGR02284 family)